jgi:hypothetical protein
MTSVRNILQVHIRDEAFSSPEEAVAFFHLLCAIHEEQKIIEDQQQKMLRSSRITMIGAILLAGCWLAMTFFNIAHALGWWGL